MIIVITPKRGQDIETEVVWQHLKVFWVSIDDATGHSERQKENEEDRRRGWKKL